MRRHLVMVVLATLLATNKVVLANADIKSGSTRHGPPSPTTDQVDDDGKRLLRAEKSSPEENDNDTRFSSVNVPSEWTDSGDNEERAFNVDFGLWNKLKLKYWLRKGVDPSVVYRHFGLTKLSGDAVQANKYYKYWAKYVEKWTAKQPQISF